MHLELDTVRMHSVPLVIGIDGGQTSTKCVLMSFDGRMLGQGSGAGLVHLSAKSAPDVFTRALAECVSSAFEAAGIIQQRQPIEAMTLALTGVERDTPEAHLAEQLARQVIQAKHIHVCSDADAALFGAHGGKPGIIAIIGTGSHIMGTNANGDIARAGGWGWLLGDEGSALWLGKSGLASALRALDGVSEPTLLEALMREHFNIATLRDVKRLVYDSSFGAKGFAALATVVSSAAAQNDGVALDLIAQAGRDLATQIMAVQRRLALPDDAPIAPVGGAYEHVFGLPENLRVALRDLNPQANLVAPQLTPVLGAALIALRLCDVAST